MHSRNSDGWLSTIRADFLLFPFWLREKLLKENEALRQVVTPAVQRITHLEEVDFPLVRSERMKSALVQPLWNYTLGYFGVGVHRCIGFRITHRYMHKKAHCEPLSWTLAFHKDNASYLCTVDYYQEFRLKCVDGKFLCDELDLYGLVVRSPTWETVVDFYRNLRIADCLQESSCLLINDIRNLVVEYIVPLCFHQKWVKTSR